MIVDRCAFPLCCNLTISLYRKQAHAIEKAISLHSLDMDREEEERVAKQQMSNSTVFLLDDEPADANISVYPPL